MDEGNNGSARVVLSSTHNYMNDAVSPDEAVDAAHTSSVAQMDSHLALPDFYVRSDACFATDSVSAGSLCNQATPASTTQAQTLSFYICK